jgi:hypothetical protein
MFACISIVISIHAMYRNSLAQFLFLLVWPMQIFLCGIRRPPYLLQPQAWCKVLPPHFLAAKQLALSLAQEYEMRCGAPFGVDNTKNHYHHNSVLSSHSLELQQKQTPATGIYGSGPYQDMATEFDGLRLAHQEGNIFYSHNVVSSYTPSQAVQQHRHPMSLSAIGEFSRQVVVEQQLFHRPVRHVGDLVDPNLHVDEAAARISSPMLHDYNQYYHQQQNTSTKMDPPDEEDNEPPSLRKHEDRNLNDSSQITSLPSVDVSSIHNVSEFQSNVDNGDGNLDESILSERFYSNGHHRLNVEVGELSKQPIINEFHNSTNNDGESEGFEDTVSPQGSGDSRYDGSAGRSALSGFDRPPVSPHSASVMDSEFSAQSSAMRGAQEMLKRNRQRRLELARKMREEQQERLRRQTQQDDVVSASTSMLKSGRTPTPTTTTFLPALNNRHADQVPCSSNTLESGATWESGSDMTSNVSGSSIWTDSSSANPDRSSRRALILQMAKARMKSQKLPTSPESETSQSRTSETDPIKSRIQMYESNIQVVRHDGTRRIVEDEKKTDLIEETGTDIDIASDLD